jgi:hydrogenase large subunit
MSPAPCKADPGKAAALAESLSSWPGNSKAEFTRVKERLAGFVGTGQLGIFTNGYWGHPAMKLPPEVNLIAVAHYLQALEVQRHANKIVSILGAKTPHIQNVAVGGVANALSIDSQSVLTVERLLAVKGWIDQLSDFVKNVYLIDVAVIGGFYPEWTAIGRGIVDYVSVPDIPLDGKNTQFALPGGHIAAGDLSSFKEIKTHDDAYFKDGVAESVKHSWYEGGKGPLHPYKGETRPQYTDFEDDGKYSWLKSPTFYGQPMQVGPLPRVSWQWSPPSTSRPSPTQRRRWSWCPRSPRPRSVSTRCTRRSAATRRAPSACAVQVDELARQWDLLLANMAKGDLTTFNKPVFPKDEVAGVGIHEAPRGVLSHWVVIDDGKIRNYQCVVPTTWNAAPRNEADAPGAYEACLAGTPVAIPDQPLEVLRTVHSFDPCLACAVHVVDTEKRPLVKVKAA